MYNDKAVQTAERVRGLLIDANNAWDRDTPVAETVERALEFLRETRTFLCDQPFPLGVGSCFERDVFVYWITYGLQSRAVQLIIHSEARQGASVYWRWLEGSSIEMNASPRFLAEKLAWFMEKYNAA